MSVNDVEVNISYNESSFLLYGNICPFALEISIQGYKMGYCSLSAGFVSSVDSKPFVEDVNDIKKTITEYASLLAKVTYGNLHMTVLKNLVNWFNQDLEWPWILADSTENSLKLVPVENNASLEATVARNGKGFKAELIIGNQVARCTGKDFSVWQVVDRATGRTLGDIRAACGGDLVYALCQ